MRVDSTKSEKILHRIFKPTFKISFSFFWKFLSLAVADPYHRYRYTKELCTVTVLFIILFYMAVVDSFSDF